ncbi:MarR family transcriptional regulator [Mycobacterium sp.]|uniref:MarR family transcriptional regulator n=1 Tax=Mycobacterium sp. TaxID=1785 RepID=UPI003A88A56D
MTDESRSPGTPVVPPNPDADDLAVLQAVRLKGRLTRADLAATVAESVADITPVVARLAAAGLLVDGPAIRISPDGRARLAELLTAERETADAAALAVVYDEFRSVNTDFKSVVTDWQLRDNQPNNHDDSDYDATVLARLDDVHRRVLPIITTVTVQLPRLAAYPRKLTAALNRVKVGELAWLTRPLIDSYHTVWFELHEELILAAGLTREEAARSGDAG